MTATIPHYLPLVCEDCGAPWHIREDLHDPTKPVLCIHFEEPETMTTAAPALANEQIHSVPAELLDESPSNTRRTWGNLEELAESIRAVGILQPLVARRLGDRFELVFGHRRYRAGKLAKLDVYPVIVRVLSDAQAQEAQVVENLQRQDLHLLEEAEGFEQLERLGWSPEDMAAKIGKSKAYVYARLKLLELVPAAREAFYVGRLSPSVALYVARVPAALQVEALAELEKEAEETSNWYPPKPGAKPAPGEIEPLPARDAADLLRSRFMLRLANAPFDRADAELVAGAGACKDCPKRSGNQPELFADVSTPDTCTDPTCFAAKKKAAAADAIAKLERKGATVVEAKGQRFGEPKPPPGYVVPRGYCHELGKDWGDVLKGKKVATAVEKAGRVVMLDAKNKPVQLVKKADVLEAAGYDPKKPRVGAYTTRTPEQQAAEEAKRLAEQAGEDLAVVQVVEAAEGVGVFSDPLLRALCGSFNEWRMRSVHERRGWKRTEVEAQIKKLKGGALVGLLVEMLVCDSQSETLEAVCGVFGIDLKGLISGELAKLKAAAKAPAPEKKAAKKGKAKR